MRISWGVLAIFAAFMGPMAALAAGGMLYVTNNPQLAAHAWKASFSALALLMGASIPVWHAQRRSARFVVIAGAMLLCFFLFFVLCASLPAFFSAPIPRLPGLALMVGLLLLIFANGSMAHHHYAQHLQTVGLPTLRKSIKGRRISIDAIGKLLKLSDVPHIFSFRNAKLNAIIPAALILMMIAGFNLRKFSPDASMFLWGAPGLIMSTWFAQPFVIAFHQYRLIRLLEKASGCSLLAEDP
jgi:hypothetical protein